MTRSVHVGELSLDAQLHVAPAATYATSFAITTSSNAFTAARFN